MSRDMVLVLDKGVFPGTAALEETAKSPPRRLVTLVVEGGEVPEYGATVTLHDEEVGTLTSPCESPMLGQTIGMAVLDSAHAGEGGTVEVAVGEGTARATVDKLPIYDPDKSRPRA